MRKKIIFNFFNFGSFFCQIFFYILKLLYFSVNRQVDIIPVNTILIKGFATNKQTNK